MSFPTFQSIKYQAQNYLNRIPANTPQEMGKAFLVGFVVRALVSESVKVGLMGGACGVVATAIYGLVSPLFQDLFSRGDLSSEFLRTGISIIGAHVFSRIFGTPLQIRLSLAMAAFQGFLLPLFDQSKCNLHRTNVTWA